MKKILWTRGILLVFLVVWAAIYMPVCFRWMEIPAPLSACQIPLLPVFDGVGMGDVLYGAFCVFTVLLALLSIHERYAKNPFVLALPALLALFDIYGEVVRYQTASFAKEEGMLMGYYYFNGITPTPPYFYLISLWMDVVWILLLFLPLIVSLFSFLRTRNRKAEVPEVSVGITTDNWAEIYEAEQKAQDLERKVGEEYKNEYGNE